MLPSPTVLREQIDRSGLNYNSSIEFGLSYSDTLREWRTRFNDRWSDIAPLGFDERFCRMWNFYLATCAACFNSGTTDVTQVRVSRPV
jgi:cyclopropane-fatty-acyl-phospholipid synthase